MHGHTLSVSALQELVADSDLRNSTLKISASAMPSGSKKRKAAKKSRQDDPEVAADIPEETQNTSEENCRPEEGQDEQCLTPRTPVREKESDDKCRMGMQISEWINVSDQDTGISTLQSQKTPKLEEPAHRASLGGWETLSHDSTSDRPEELANLTMSREMTISGECHNIKEDENLCGLPSADATEVASSPHEGGLGDSVASLSTEWDSVAGSMGAAGADVEEVGQQEIGKWEAEGGADLEKVGLHEVGDLEGEVGEVVQQVGNSADTLKLGNLGDPAGFLSTEWDSVESILGESGANLEEISLQEAGQLEEEAGADSDRVGQVKVVDQGGEASVNLEEVAQQAGELQYTDSTWLEEESQFKQASRSPGKIWVQAEEPNNQYHFSETSLQEDGVDIVRQKQASESQVNLAFSSDHINVFWGLCANPEKSIDDNLSQLCSSLEGSLSHQHDSRMDSIGAVPVADTSNTSSSEIQVTTLPVYGGEKLLHVEEYPVVVAKGTSDSEVMKPASIFSTAAHIDELKLNGEVPGIAEEHIVCENGKDTADALMTDKVPVEDACEELTPSDVMEIRDESHHTAAECSSSFNSIADQPFDQDGFQMNTKVILNDELTAQVDEAVAVLEDEGEAASQTDSVKVTDDAPLYIMLSKNRDGSVEVLAGEKGCPNLSNRRSDANIEDTIISSSINEEADSRLVNGNDWLTGRGLHNDIVNDYLPGRCSSDETAYQGPEECPCETYMKGAMVCSSEIPAVTNEPSKDYLNVLVTTVQGGCTDTIQATGIIPVLAPAEEEDILLESTDDNECKDSCEKHELCSTLECTVVVKDCSDVLANTEKASEAVCMDDCDMDSVRDDGVETDAGNGIERQDSCSHESHMEGTVIPCSECTAVMKEQNLDHSNILASTKDVVQAVCMGNQSTGLPVIVHVGVDLQNNSNNDTEWQYLCENGIEPSKDLKGRDIKSIYESNEATTEQLLDCFKHDTEEVVPTVMMHEIQASSLCVAPLREESSYDPECLDSSQNPCNNYEEKAHSSSECTCVPNDQSWDCSDMSARGEAVQAVSTDKIQATSLPVVVSVRKEELHVSERTFDHSKEEDLAASGVAALGQKHITKWWECCGMLELVFHRS